MKEKEKVILAGREYYKEIEDGIELFTPVEKKSFMEKNGMRYKLMPMYGTEILVEEWIQEEDLVEKEPFIPTEYQIERMKAIKENMPNTYKRWIEPVQDLQIKYLKEFQEKVEKRKEELKEAHLKSYIASKELAPEGSLTWWQQMNMIELMVNEQVMKEMVLRVNTMEVLRWLDRNSIPFHYSTR